MSFLSNERLVTSQDTPQFFIITLLFIIDVFIPRSASFGNERITEIIGQNHSTDMKFHDAIRH